MIDAYMRTVLSVVGYHLDVVSLANASMVCRLWKAAFENHPKWKEFYLNSDESAQDPLDKKGPWRILYGELFNKCKSLMYNTWMAEDYRPAITADYLRCQDPFVVNGKLVVTCNKQLFTVDEQQEAKLKYRKVLRKYLDEPLERVVFPLIISRNDGGNGNIESIQKIQLDRNFLYASTNDGQILRWERSHFPGEYSIIYNGGKIDDFKIQNEILYILHSTKYTDELFAFKNSEELWRLELTNETYYNMLVNKNIGMIRDDWGQFYLWDSCKGEKPIKFHSMCEKQVLMNDEVIFAYGFLIMAHSLKGSRVIYRMKNNINSIIPNCDQNVIYIISEYRYITTFCLLDNKVISEIDLGETDTPYFGLTKLFNGILYCVDNSGRLNLIDPKKGIIRKSPKYMFNIDFEVHNGRVYGLSPNEERVIIVYADDNVEQAVNAPSVESKPIRHKKCIIC